MASGWGLGVLLFCFVCSVSAYSEPGIYSLTLSKVANLGDFQRSLYNQSKIIVNLNCKDAMLNVRWWLWKAECLQAFQSLNNMTVDLYKSAPFNAAPLVNGAVWVASDLIEDYDCNTDHYVRPNSVKVAPDPVPLGDVDDKKNEDKESALSTTVDTSPSVSTTTAAGKTPQTAKTTDAKTSTTQIKSTTNTAAVKVPANDSQRKRRAAAAADKPTGQDAKADSEAAGAQQDPNNKEGDAIFVTRSDGIYLLLIEIDTDTDVEINVQMKTDNGYLSPIDWPNLPFYGTMCVLYVVYGLVWLVMLALNWRDLLRVQFWIGAVILLGMLEKAVYFGEYESINSTGFSVRGALIFAELVSSFKRTLARMLVIIVSLGYGIVKPRLGADQNKVVGIGILFFVLSSVEGCMRVAKNHGERTNGKDILGLLFMVTLLEVYICYWIFTSLVQTTRVLRLRRNVVKLSLYRHFTNTLVFAVLASLAFMIWSMSKHRFVTCLSDWKEIWVDEAFWHMLFCVILLVIIILWRPSINNQRYAFSPLLDAVEEEDEDDETPMSDAFDGMNKRPRDDVRNIRNQEKKRDKVDDDLKWIDENIPASVADAALPSLLDSDEEIVTTKFEVSKME